MRRHALALLATTALSVGFTQIASAADLPVKAVPAAVVAAYNWTGCYGGGYLGGAWASRNARSTDLNGYNALGDTWTYSLNGSVIVGGTLGCNQQINNWVWGAEGELGYMKVDGAAFDPLSPFIPLDTEARTKIGSWYGVVAGRAGYAWDRMLAYGKLGIGIASVEQGVNDANPAGGNTIFTRGTSTKAALAIGGGLEYAMPNGWTLKGEYLYLDFKASDTTCGNATVGGGRFCWSNDFRGVHTAKLGFNYFFGAH